MFTLLFPKKCVLCRKLLTKKETDLCHHCRTHAPEFNRPKTNIPFIAHWNALWYYMDDVRGSILRFKFGNLRYYADVYARLLGLKLQDTQFDVLTWVPTSALRKLKRGYDQSELIARSLGREYGIPAKRTLKKIRHTPPQSGLKDAAQRRANVLSAYRATDREGISGKRILLLDDVVTTGATASECARTLLVAGAKEVYLAAVAAASHDKNK